MKTEIEDGVLIVKGFDARYFLVNGLTSLIILLCAIEAHPLRIRPK